MTCAFNSTFVDIFTDINFVLKYELGRKFFFRFQGHSSLHGDNVTHVQN